MTDPIYRTAGLWGAGKGSNLTPLEVDTNFYNIVVRLGTLETDLPEAARGVDHIEVSANQLSIFMTDDTIEGPFDLPSQTWRALEGGWLPATLLVEGDVFTESGTVYVVAVDHTSGASFSAGATNGSGLDLYTALFTFPASVMPAGGTAGQVLAKVDGTDYNFDWFDNNLSDLSDVSITSPLTDGDVLAWDDAEGKWVSGAPAAGTLDSLTDVSLGSPLSPGEFLKYNGADWIGAAVVRTLDLQINQTDLLAHTAQYLVAPCAGTIEGLDAIVQVGVTTGGTIKVQINGVDVTSAIVTVANAASAGTAYSAEATAANTLAKGDIIKIVTASFASAGAVNVSIRFK